jgi:hypothetical protein
MNTTEHIFCSVGVNPQRVNDYFISAPNKWGRYNSR